jgi:beta-lactamase regulating signal transducer with metallopeptidase domain
MTDLTNHPATLALGGALLHFLWQGAAIGLACFAMLRLTRLGPPARYTIGVVTLAVMLAAPIATFAVLISREDDPRAAADLVDLDLADRSLAGNQLTGQANAIAPIAPVVSPEAPSAGRFAQLVGDPATLRVALLSLWLTGVVVLSLRLLGGWLIARRLAARAIRPVTPEIQSLTRRVAGRLALDRAVRIVESSAVSVPAMIGWMKPVILLPAAALSGLSPGQLEALIAHELAHVRRHDYLVNLLQTAVETLLFYHPAVWWTSRQVRTEREHCCDDLAVGVCDRLAYVTALANLAAMSSRPRFAMAATGGSLLHRVRRILGQPPADRGGRAAGWIAALTIVTVGGALVAATTRARSGDQTATATAATQSASAENRAVAAITGGAPAASVMRAETEDAQAAARQATASTSAVEVQAASAAAQAADAARLAELQRTLEELAALQQAQTRDTRERARAEALQVDAKEYERLLQQQGELERRRIELEARAREVQSNVRMAQLEAELAAAGDALARVRKQFEVGLASEETVRQVELQIRAAEQQLMAAKLERDLQKQEMELRLREAEVARDSAVRRLVLEQRLREKMPQSDAQVDELRARIRDLEQMLQARYGLSREGGAQALAGTELVTNPNEEARPGDLLVIEIAGEPDLPRQYQVRSDGTIRLPLIGSVSVGGSTAVQVRDAIAKLMADRKLGTDRGVAVSLRRPRGES